MLSALLGLLARTFSDVIVKEVDSLRHDQDQRDLGASRQANASTAAAEAAEAKARAAGDAAADNDDDPRDLRPEDGT
ncbi:peptidoglycan-binding protein [Methylobacterium mesophilicum SR1.6/6]|uniref:Peptidoglycan-binding protein n=1 Tax=Methylobacterium mesophilicum SR1.6/6 TaxID=908290 RepID=A0A6B9FTW9_9HYPH|nr:peptidoglycan-binding protein [Methylobacterium mesophilicum SR1.6/6]